MNPRINTFSIRSTLLAAVVATGALAGLALPTTAQAAGYISVQIGPPPMRVEAVPVARPGWVWAPGHYEWQRGAYFWVPGAWVRERPGYAYVAPVWLQRGGAWEYRPARWDARPPGYYRPPYGGRGDYDRDGIPNRYDRHPGYRHDRDRDGVPDRYDRDRDGDGVGNRHDRRPDNRYRY